MTQESVTNNINVSGKFPFLYQVKLSGTDDWTLSLGDYLTLTDTSDMILLSLDIELLLMIQEVSGKKVRFLKNFRGLGE